MDKFDHTATFSTSVSDPNTNQFILTQMDELNKKDNAVRDIVNYIVYIGKDFNTKEWPEIVANASAAIMAALAKEPSAEMYTMMECAFIDIFRKCYKDTVVLYMNEKKA